MIDGSVRDKVRAQEILSLLAAVVHPEAVVRVTTRAVKVAQPRKVVYTRKQGETGEVTP